MQDKQDEVVKCQCGYHKNSYFVEKKQKYTSWGWIALLFGISAKPIEVKYQCSKCNQVLDRITDPEELNNYI
ncbi:MAG: hypothetical protein JNN15_06030 [Blastocatellia bacterium]|nr:hypothetical protein [Blastocatellia bacterium]